jgi:nicotinate-nucleotide pyrophosphorylase (carboxylating)
VRPDYISDHFLTTFIHDALQEDMGDGDHSSLGCIPASRLGRARLLTKEDGVLAGVELAEHIFKQFDPAISVNLLIQDGSKAQSGDTVLTVEGHARSILATERLVLNCMQRMSGIATTTRKMVNLVSGTNAELMDTRKTTPNFRLLEKWAVAIGGARNHRMGLFDMIMLKDNHIDLAGGIKEAINRTKHYLRANDKNLRIEVEVRTIKEVQEVMETGGVDVIMLDNMTLNDMKRAVELIQRRCKIEASGGITENTIRDVAACGVDYISVGALTHSVKSLDLSLKFF